MVQRRHRVPLRFLGRWEGSGGDTRKSISSVAAVLWLPAVGDVSALETMSASGTKRFVGLVFRTIYAHIGSCISVRILEFMMLKNTLRKSNRS